MENSTFTMRRLCFEVPLFHMVLVPNDLQTGSYKLQYSISTLFVHACMLTYYLMKYILKVFSLLVCSGNPQEYGFYTFKLFL